MGQSQISDGWCVRFRIDENVPFAVACVQAIVINPVALLRVDCPPNFSAAVVTLHASYLYPVYQARRKPRAKAIIDIDHRYAGGA